MERQARSSNACGMPCLAVGKGESVLECDLFEGLSARLGLGVVLTSEGKVLRVSEAIEREFPGVFTRGASFEEMLDGVTTPEESNLPYLCGPGGAELADKVLRGGSLRLRVRSNRTVQHFSHFRFAVCAAAESERGGLEAHCLLDIQPQKQLFEAFRSDLEQLSSLREIIDLFFESTEVAEVINQILVAVTAGQGFSFNRAFFLEVVDRRLKGRFGIGPADAQEAHRIWSRLAETNTTLRETLVLLSEVAEPPDPATQRLAQQIDLPLDLQAREEDPSGILQACCERRPALVTASTASSPAEREVFRLLGCDALAVVPLNVQNRLAGVLLADNFITGRAISPQDLKLLKTFSGYAAIALERSHLHDELTRNLDKLRTANRELQTHQHRLLHAEKLSALGKMAACVSHEIRNPLVAIGGLARSVLEDESCSDDAREVLGIVVSEVERLERFLKETLSFVKPCGGPFKPVDLTALVRSVISTFREDIQSRQIDLEVNLPDEPVVSSLDPDLCRGAISNLIRNANEALGFGGQIGVRLSVRGGVIEIDVGDTGPGVPDEMRALIFEPFVTGKDDGTGIGLAITQQNIHSLGGNISLEDDSCYRTLFRIRLPLHAEPSRASERTFNAPRHLPDFLRSRHGPPQPKSDKGPHSRPTRPTRRGLLTETRDPDN